ncbi:site-specific integrase, partial [Streptococcus sp. UBA632]|uniref:site-specific integrase n=1 Tax=Streptococcus sp. UBA632 TaxID=1947566 RepID=UPI0025E552C3
RNCYYKTLYLTLLATGLRIGEAVALEWSDIDLDNGVIDVNKTLNNRIEINSPKSMASYRQISIDKATILMLKQYKNRQHVKAWELGRSEKVVFSNFTDKYIDPNNIRNQLYKHFKNAGVPNVRFHGLRHTHATLMLNAGMSPKDLQHRLGHSNITMTLNIYVHATEEGAKQGGNIFEMAINNL